MGRPAGSPNKTENKETEVDKIYRLIGDFIKVLNSKAGVAYEIIGEESLKKQLNLQIEKLVKLLAEKGT